MGRLLVGVEWYRKSKWLIDQLFYSREHLPCLTHYVATVQKKGPRLSERPYYAAKREALRPKTPPLIRGGTKKWPDYLTLA